MRSEKVTERATANTTTRRRQWWILPNTVNFAQLTHLNFWTKISAVKINCSLFRLKTFPLACRSIVYRNHLSLCRRRNCGEASTWRGCRLPRWQLSANRWHSSPSESPTNQQCLPSPMSCIHQHPAARNRQRLETKSVAYAVFRKKTTQPKCFPKPAPSNLLVSCTTTRQHCRKILPRNND